MSRQQHTMDSHWAPQANMSPHNGGLDTLARRQRAPNPILGVLLALTLMLFMGAFWWLTSGQSLPLLQLPLVMFSFIAAVTVGFLYFLNPARVLTYLLLGLLFFSFEVTARGQETGGGDAQTMVKGILALMFAVFGLFTSVRYVFASVSGFFLTYYAVWALGTSSYSPALVLGLASGIALLGVTLVSNRIGMGEAEDVRDFWTSIYWASVMICILSFMVLAISPMQAKDLTDPGTFRFRGVTGAANALGPIMGLGAIMAMAQYRLTKRSAMRWVHSFMMLAFVAALFLTNSRSSIVGFIVAMLLTEVVIGSFGVLGTMVLALLSATFGVAMAYPGLLDSIMSGLASAFSRSGSVSELTTLTGRQDIWAACWKLFLDQPIWGYGLGSVRVVLPLAYSDVWGNTMSTAHNMLLESLLSVGVAGTIPLLALIFVCLRTLIGFFRRQVKSGLSSLAPSNQGVNVLLGKCALRCLLMLLVQGISEKAFAGQPGSSTLALGAIMCTTAYLSRKNAPASKM
jgi:O-antigen ligase